MIFWTLQKEDYLNLGPNTNKVPIQIRRFARYNPGHVALKYKMHLKFSLQSTAEGSFVDLNEILGSQNHSTLQEAHT